jgi:hypothetical protein
MVARVIELQFSSYGAQSDAASTVLERLQVVLSLEMEEFQSTIDNLEASLAVCVFSSFSLPSGLIHLSIKETPEASLRYIIIDPITPLLFAQITGSSSQGHFLPTN